MALMEEDAREERLKDQQDGRVYSVGRALRATFDADNHDSLDGNVAGLMIHLSREPDPPFAPEPPLPAERPGESAPRSSWFARIGRLFISPVWKRTK